MSEITCKISGERLIRSDLLLGFDFAAVHPVFRAKKEIILSQDTVFRYYKAPSWQEKKLWWMAVLNSMELIEWKLPGIPQPHTIEFSFETAFQLACWIDYARHGIRDKIAFPKYIVGPDNQNMANAPVWLDEIGEIRKLFLQKDREDSLKRQLNDEAIRIEKEFRKASLTGHAFTHDLAKFALEACGVEEPLFGKYMEILKTPLEDAWILDRHMTEEIYEFFQEELPIHHQSFLSVRVQAQKLMEAAKRGFKSFGREDGSKEETPTYRIINGSGEEGAYRVPIENLPELGPEPQRAMFSKHWEYLSALAKWKLERDRRNPGASGEYRQF